MLNGGGRSRSDRGASSRLEAFGGVTFTCNAAASAAPDSGNAEPANFGDLSAGISPKRAVCIASKRGMDMKPSRFTEEQIIAILREQEVGARTGDVCRKYGISSETSVS